MLKFLFSVFFITAFSLCSFSTEKEKEKTGNPKEKSEIIKPESKKPLLPSCPPGLYGTEVEVNLICGGLWTGWVCHQGVELTSAEFTSVANWADIRNCGYTIEEYWWW